MGILKRKTSRVAIYEEILLEGAQTHSGLMLSLTAAQDGFSRGRGRGINYPRVAHSGTVWFRCWLFIFHSFLQGIFPGPAGDET